jgi:glycosyltransferase involved in cell wall biosynthesis
MSNPPLFSLAVPTKNRSFLLPDTINAVLNQTFADWELIIADNDDTDAQEKL